MFHKKNTSFKYMFTLGMADKRQSTKHPKYNKVAFSHFHQNEIFIGSNGCSFSFFFPSFTFFFIVSFFNFSVQHGIFFSSCACKTFAPNTFYFIHTYRTYGKCIHTCMNSMAVCSLCVPVKIQVASYFSSLSSFGGGMCFAVYVYENK